ncbi:laminin subunit alpha-5-like isoform X2 [Clavelina lepadiformis]|uniref:laminin subunit alpha-5-like isoform X2 n=1 Tax=Clavelina lepadiformis TaxID=159417 RepID=UPI004041D2F0
MLRFAIALALLCFCNGQVTNGDTPIIREKSPNVLSPPYFNIATGKRIDTTATCGQEGPDLFCKLTGGTNFEYSTSLHEGQVCDVCASNIPEKSHPVKNAIDGTEKWWQSPPLSRGNEYNKVNLTIHLGQVFHVAYVLIKFANSPRAGTWVLEHSSDYGHTYQPWQYFANTDSDCYNLFGMDSLEEITRDDSVVCTSDYSSVVPLENGEVIVSMVKGRPGAQNFSYATVLQEWSKATDVRLRFLRTKTLLGHLMAVSEQDPTVTRRYYYSIKDISIGGRCVCNGHADTCSPDPQDQYKLKCECRHNTCGDSCEYCCAGFVQKAWRPAVPESTNECEACNCYGHSNECVYDEDVALRRLSLDLLGNYEGGGMCQNCQHNTAGINCEQCASGYWRPADIDPSDPNGCRPCECDSAYTIGSCEPTTGRCYCKVQYAGDRCDRCAPGYYDFPECRPCDCYYNGTLNDVCLPVGDACPCKYNFAGKYCDECAAGFYLFPTCDACECVGEGVASDVCDPYTGDCPCADGFAGKSCTECAPGYFNYPLCQRCPCSDIGTTDEVCDSLTGECFCDEKYAGVSCDDCKSGYFGFPLCQECECTAPGSLNNTCDSGSGRCNCKPNYQGNACEECAPEFYGYPNCLSCACNVRGSLKTTCDQTTGDCLCRDNVQGRACDTCTPDYFNFPKCEECSCDVRGIVSVVPGVCLAFTTGQCECKENVVGKNCDMCKPLHYDLDRGCISCNCFIQGTLDGVGECDREDGQCWCKPYTCTQRCSQCASGFYELEELNYLGCTSCQCDVGGAMTIECDKSNGQCECKTGIGGRRCNRALEGYYYPTLYQNQYELEDGRTPENTFVRAGFNPEEFPNFSYIGYAQYSVVQPTVMVPVVTHNSGLYRLMFYYYNTGPASRANVTVSPNQPEYGTEQSYSVTFPNTQTPRIVTVPTPFVLNRGTWTVVLEAAPGLLVDYFVLMPSEYYEPGILRLTATVPCVPSASDSGKECVMFTHPSLEAFTTVELSDSAPEGRITAPTTAHPEMLFMDGTTGVDGDREFTTDITLPKAGKYVLVLEYASTEDRFQKGRVTVTDGAGNTYDDAKFNIYSCPYSFLCRQVALAVLNDVKVFDVSLPTMKVTVQTDAGNSFYVKSLTAIPLADWTMELVEPKPRCITTQGPKFDECVAGKYKVPVGSTRVNVAEPIPDDAPEDASTGPRPDTINDDKVPLVYLDGADDTGSGQTRLQIPMRLNPGRYVFLVHYYNPKHTSFSPRVLIDGGVASPGTANVTYCPHGDGCRAVVTLDNGGIVADISVPTTTVTLDVPEDKSFWVQYVLAVPEAEYNPKLLDLEPIDKSSDFIEQCATDSQKSFYDTVHAPTEFCQESVFSLTVDYNDGALECNCSGAGTVGGADAVCNDYGGQCPCKVHIVGRQCDQCMVGFYGYPECRECDCGGALCDDVTGECICPPNTVKPDCNSCAPFTHSFHPLAGCVECDCNLNGVLNISDTGCNPGDGQCNCKEHVTGQRCDQCELGYYGFPECKQCTCDERGSISDKCDPVTGQCSRCKENVEGLQCDRCKEGTFFLDINNPKGCTSCFCFGVSDQCRSSQYPSTEIYDMEKWRMLYLVEPRPEVTSTNNGRTVQVNIAENGGPENPSKPGLYWAAPKTYLEDQVSSYGGKLRYTTLWSTEQPGRGDAAGSSSGSVPQPAPLLGIIPDLILKGNDMVIGWVNDASLENVQLELSERNFQHQDSGNAVTREEMMMVLADLQALHIRASPEVGVTTVALQDVVMTTTDYGRPVGSAPGIPTVEECTCPPGYHGHSCQYCDDGHFRSDRGPYLGYCEKCDCYPNCKRCDDTGALLDGDECLHNTGGENCGVCEDGYIGNATSGEIDSCKPCPCPFPVEGGNFADTCEEVDGEMVCHCQMGYTGQRCELCASGYFGNPAVYGGDCKPCNCHGNLDPNLVMPTCDSLTGKCTDCAFNTGGDYCERCADGYYGDAIVARNCTECSCNSCGTEACDYDMGHCSCRPNVIGALCDTCEPGFWNFQSCSGCRSCACAEGALGDECRIETGQCDCAPNIVGLRCDKCAPGYWDYSPEGCKPCNCRNNGKCNPANGLCECPPGITGAQCDECELSRHILELGAAECTRCDSCIDDLLDEIEPETTRVTDAYGELSNISVGLLAVQRLQSLQEQVDAMEDKLDSDEDLMGVTSTNVNNLINGGLDELGEEISGSGESEVLSDTLPFGDFRSPSFNQLDTRISQTEAAASEMCNRTNVLLNQVTKTENITNTGLVDADALNDSASQFQKDAQDLLDKLNTESSGDSDDYFEKLRNAQMMLERMQERDFSPMMKTADDELNAAQELLDRVEGEFTTPAENATQRVSELSNNFNDTHNKLRDLRNKINDATQKTIAANTANAINQKNLTQLSQLIDDVNADSAMADELLNDADFSISKATELLDGPITDGIDELDNLATSLEDTYNQLQDHYNDWFSEEDMNHYELLKNQSIEHVAMLEEDANAIKAIAKNDSGAPEAANRYRNIVNAMNAASSAADDAHLEAVKAKMNVEDKNLGSEAEDANDRASELLTATQNMQDKEFNKLSQDMEDTKDKLDTLENMKDELRRKLDKIDSDLDDLNLGNVNDRVRETEDMVEEANRLSDEADAQADDLQRAIENAPEGNVDLERDLEEVRAIMDALPETISNMEEAVANAETTKARLDELETTHQMVNRINDIQKLILLARDKANMVKSTIQFATNDPNTEYVELRMPQAVEDLDTNIHVQLDAQVSPDSPDNAIFYLGDSNNPDSDFIALDTVNGRPRFHFKVGRGKGMLESEVPINDGNWHTIVIQRSGNQGVLKVETIAVDGRGDGGNAANSYEVTDGTTNQDDMIASMTHAGSNFFVGGNPATPPDGVQRNVNNVCIGRTTVNNETAGLWNFKAYRGPSPGRNCYGRHETNFVVTVPGNLAGSANLGLNTAWRFSGRGSYIRIGRGDTPFLDLDANAKAHYVSFRFETLQENGLLFLVGESIEQFFAVEMVNGKLVVTWNFGFTNGPRNATAETSPEITKRKYALLMKAGIIPALHKVIVAFHGDTIAMNEDFENTPIDVRGDLWFGGQWHADIKPEFNSVLSSMNVSYRGCIRDLNFNGKTFDIQNSKEKLGVSPGCSKDSVQALKFQGSDYIKVPTALPNAEEVEGGTVVRSTVATGTVASVKETETDRHVSVFFRDGHIVLSDGARELESHGFYADGRDHEVIFARRADGFLKLGVDRTDNKELLPDLPEDLSRRRRQNTNQRVLYSRVNVFLGGVEHLPMFHGCIKNLYIKGDRYHPHFLTEGLKCGVAGTVCGGNPLFNACGPQASPPPDVLDISEVSTRRSSKQGKKGKNKRKRRRHRTRAGNRANDLVVALTSVPDYDPGYDLNCYLPYEPASSGFKYIGDGYSKYFVKRFNPHNWRYSLRIRTTEKQGLIFFMSDTRCHEHVAVYLMKGKVAFSVMFGEERSRIKSLNRYNDGAWHKITFERKGNTTQLMLDGSIEGRATMFSESMTFPSNMPFYIGGLHAVPKRHATDQIQLKNLVDFQGCIQDTTINGVNVDSVSNPSAVRINVTPCFDGGTEPGMFFPNRNGITSAHLIAMNSCNVATNMEVSLEIKPRSQSGVLFAVSGSTGNFFNLALVEGRIAARLRQGGETLFSRYNPATFGRNLCDGQWHKIRVIKAKNIIALTVDDHLVTPIEEGALENSNCYTDGPLFIGGVPDRSTGMYIEGLLTDSQYVGCIRKMRLDFLSINTNSAYRVYGDITPNACPM